MLKEISDKANNTSSIGERDAYEDCYDMLEKVIEQIEEKEFDFNTHKETKEWILRLLKGE